jgi:hypothetical protein
VRFCGLHGTLGINWVAASEMSLAETPTSLDIADVLPDMFLLKSF